MADYRQVESMQLDFNTTQAEGLDFNFPSGSGSSVQRLVLKASEDVFIHFDGDAATSESFLLEASDGPLVLDKLQCTKISALGKTQSGILYVLGVR